MARTLFGKLQAEMQSQHLAGGSVRLSEARLANSDTTQTVPSLDFSSADYAMQPRTNRGGRPRKQFVDCGCPLFQATSTTHAQLVSHTYSCLVRRRGDRSLEEYYGSSTPANPRAKARTFEDITK